MIKGLYDSDHGVSLGYSTQVALLKLM